MEFPFIVRKKAAILGIGVGTLGKDMFIHRLSKGKGKGRIECLFTFFFLAPLYYTHHSLALSGGPH